MIFDLSWPRNIFRMHDFPVRYSYYISYYVISVADVALPTSVDFVRSEPNHMVAAYNNRAAYIFDIETAKPIVNFEYEQDTGECYTLGGLVVGGWTCDF